MLKLFEKFKSLGQYFKKDEPNSNNMNAFVKTKQNIWGVILIVLVMIFIILLHFLAQKSHHKNTPQTTGVSKSPDGVLSVDFSQKNSLSALEQQQRQIDGLNKHVDSLTHALKKEKRSEKNESTKLDAAFKKSQHFKSSAVKNPILNLQPTSTAPKLIQENHSVYSRLGTFQNSPDMSIQQPRELNAISFHYKQPKHHKAIGAQRHMLNKHYKNVKTWVPAGTFSRAVLLEGADANASVNGQSDTLPILIRFLDQGTLPNGFHSHLKGCFALASIYGDISSERAEARLDKITCTKKDGTIVERRVQGYISFAGKEGIRGRPVMRNGKILAMAGISGALSGVGGALQQGAQTQSISPLGATSSLTGTQVWKNGLYGGASTAMGQLAQYYIKRADQYHPIISIGSGTVATVIFQSGFSLNGQPNKSSRQTSTTNNKQSESNSSEIKSLLEHAQHISRKHAGDSPFSNVAQMNLGQKLRT